MACSQLWDRREGILVQRNKFSYFYIFDAKFFNQVREDACACSL